MSEPNVSNLTAGPSVLYLAASGTAFPSLAAKPTPTNWATAGFLAVGFTESGIECLETPSVKDITPDEMITVAKQIPTGIKYEIKMTLLEATIENLNRALAFASLSNPGLGIKTLSVGSANALQEFALGIQGPSVGGSDDRVVTVWRVNSLAAVGNSYTRKDVTKVPVTFTALADTTKATNRDVYEIVDFNAGS